MINSFGKLMKTSIKFGGQRFKTDNPLVEAAAALTILGAGAVYAYKIVKEMNNNKKPLEMNPNK